MNVPCQVPDLRLPVRLVNDLIMPGPMYTSTEATPLRSSRALTVTSTLRLSRRASIDVGLNLVQTTFGLRRSSRETTVTGSMPKRSTSSRRRVRCEAPYSSRTSTSHTATLKVPNQLRGNLTFPRNPSEVRSSLAPRVSFRLVNTTDTSCALVVDSSMVTCTGTRRAFFFTLIDCFEMDIEVSSGAGAGPGTDEGSETTTNAVSSAGCRTPSSSVFRSLPAWSLATAMSIVCSPDSVVRGTVMVAVHTSVEVGVIRTDEPRR